MKNLILLISFLCSLNLAAKNSYSVIPYPNKLIKLEGFFEFKTNLTVTMPVRFKSELDLMKEIFADEYHVKIIESQNGKLVFKENETLPQEAYILSVNSNQIIVEASTTTGCFYAVQTIRQLMSLSGNGSYSIANCSITDQPAFSWRAYLLDEARYFKGKDVVKEILDEMAMLKMNVMQWHLTDDAGWRVEIKKYPLLTETGAWRDSTQSVNWQGKIYDSNPHGGYYSQNEIRELVEYASKRHITIVPEIEMPGHMSAAIAAYPWLGASGKAIRVPVDFGVRYDVLNIAEPKVYTFLYDVLKEIMDLFPGKVIHIGGDEVRNDQWKTNAAINDIMKKEGFKNYSDMHVYFVNRISKYIENNGRRMMGWNDILGKNVHEWSNEANTTQSLAKNTIIHFWKGDPALLEDALAQGYEIVNSYHEFTYLDYNYKSIPLEKAYQFDPAPKEISAEKKRNILGSGCQMWGEWIPSVADLHRQTFPRIAAYAEDGWTKTENKDYARFKNSLINLKYRWDKKGIFYSKEE